MVHTIESTHNVTAEAWSKEVMNEYVNHNPFFNFMGENSNSLIQVNEELTKQAGDAITVQLRSKLTGTGVTGATALKGSEEDLIFHAQKITVDTLRHGVVLKGEMSEKRVAFSLRNQAREALVDWACEKITQNIITALTDTSVGRDQSRYIYGATDANWDATHATALATVDATDDKLSTKMISIAKRKALLSGDRRVRPFQIKKGDKYEETYVLFAHPFAIRDLLEDVAFREVNTNNSGTLAESVYVHGQKVKGSWDGVLIVECEDMPVLAGAGASSADVAHCVLAGAQAACIAWGKKTNYKEESDDYGHENGFAIDEIRGVEKLVFNGVDHGVVNLFTAAMSD
ncbi:MAG: N4-gp56 family major capsid protein [Proteobacteria bacterium]|nr:N4-gp56 family major capsid protein [Pseudomonadota bacterium]